ncbi:Dephospho-CoA kinase [Bordetella tumbae]|uniref:GrpB family protein n=1 Tax=Bordetella tumbae TaxID=1649139 RepID=UPI0039EFA7CA
MNTEKTVPLRTSASEITIFEEGDPHEDPWVLGQAPVENIEVGPYDAGWPMLYETLKKRIDIALAGKARAIEHVGSTAVPGLSAKPVIDIDVIVDDPTNEDAYVPALVELGYTLIIRERSWYQHRMLRHESPRVNLHVFGPNCPEHIRHILFRDWLSAHPRDRNLYADAKVRAAHGAETVQEYNLRKQGVIREIYARIFDSYRP